jgi:hypothetical protein
MCAGGPSDHSCLRACWLCVSTSIIRRARRVTATLAFLQQDKPARSASCLQACTTTSGVGCCISCWVTGDWHFVLLAQMLATNLQPGWGTGLHPSSHTGIVIAGVLACTVVQRQAATSHRGCTRRFSGRSSQGCRASSNQVAASLICTRVVRVERKRTDPAKEGEDPPNGG